MVPADEILEILNARGRNGLFVTELAARLGLGRESRRELDTALEELEEAHAILVMNVPPPDPHLATFDLRVVSALPRDTPADVAEQRAFEGAQSTWDAWLREFLSTHRCD